ncbi:radical SAM protein [Prolixibacter sp. NT017]|uniref:radical SAM protein n=1 Tax=Prolixibacter sp. NT017 TaxID=2652390 RepID=UPI00126BAF6C|nr:radical SAM protein [Prolixibacter sp. NT017]GET25007.1 hypothetical protein NT017_13360 [Prolixibacter sp. NT017]
MNALIKYRNDLVERNRLEYGVFYDQLKWLGHYEAIELEAERDQILERLKDNIQTGFKETKVDTRNLSPGCRLCGAGEWSCLFINNRCNAHCFYCPAPQETIGVPETQTIDFHTPEEYVAYIKKMGFKGVSFSGGEPFLTFERVKTFLKALRDAFGNELYIWMYTNGILSTPQKLKELAELGLNEIRFDIGATNYNLKKVKQAIGIIPVVTVEVPAVPDELEQLKKAVKELAEAGLSHLNLHQMRLTPYNLPKLIDRNFQFAHGPRVTLPDSEITALKILEYTKQEQINLPVNYCSYAYKSRYQKSGFRNKLAPFIVKPFEEITEKGYIRNLAIVVSDWVQFRQLFAQLPESEQGEIQVNDKQAKVLLKAKILEHFLPVTKEILVSYTNMRLSEQTGDIPDVSRISLTSARNIYIESGFVVNDLSLHPNQSNILLQLINAKQPKECFEDEQLFIVWQHEQIEEGLPEYF